MRLSRMPTRRITRIVSCCSLMCGMTSAALIWLTIFLPMDHLEGEPVARACS